MHVTLEELSARSVCYNTIILLHGYYGTEIAVTPEIIRALIMERGFGSVTILGLFLSKDDLYAYIRWREELTLVTDLGGGKMADIIQRVYEDLTTKTWLPVAKAHSFELGIQRQIRFGRYYAIDHGSSVDVFKLGSPISEPVESRKITHHATLTIYNDGSYQIYPVLEDVCNS